MDESRRDAREDISLIRQMLEQALSGMKSIAPWFTGFGMAWLGYGAFSALQRLAMLRVSLSAANRLSFAGAVAGGLFCVALAAGFLICRSRMTHLGPDSPGRKLVNTWGICIFLFLSLTVLLNPVVQIISAHLNSSAQAAASLSKACALCGDLLFFLFPVAPLLITSEFLDDRRMLFAGIFLSILSATVMCCHAFMLFGDGFAPGNGWKVFWFGAACLLDLAPGAMLLTFGRQMKGK